MKAIRRRRGEYKVCGFTNRFASYGKNAKGDYRLEIEYGNMITLPLYSSKKKPIFRNIYIITWIFAPLYPIVFIGYIILSIIINYLEGAKNFIHDSVWVTNVRFFNWTSIVFILILTVLLFLK